MPRKIQYGDYGTIDFPDNYTDDQIKEYINENYKYIENQLQVPIQEDLEGSFLDTIIPSDNMELGLRNFLQNMKLVRADLGYLDPDDAAYDARVQQKRIGELYNKLKEEDPETMAAYEDAANAEGFSQAVSVIAKNPSALIPLVLQSLGSYLPAIGTATGVGLVTRGLGTGPLMARLLTVGSFSGANFATEYGSSFVDTFVEEGVDVNDPQQIIAALDNEELKERAREKGVKRGIPIVAFDALSFGLAGKILAMTKRAGKAGLGSKLLRAGGYGAEIGLAGTLGGMGEAAAQIASEGSITKPGEVVLEAFAEGPTGLIEAGVNALQKKQKLKDQDKVTEDPDNPNPGNIEMKEEEMLEEDDIDTLDESFVDEPKRIKESAGSGQVLRYPNFKAYVDDTRKLITEGALDPQTTGIKGKELEKETKKVLKQFGVTTQKEFNKLREKEINQFVEEPAQDALKKVYNIGGFPVQSNAYGQGPKGVTYKKTPDSDDFEFMPIEQKSVKKKPKATKPKEKFNISKQETATAFEAIQQILNETGPGRLTKAKIRKQLPKPIEVYLKKNKDIEDGIYKVFVDNNYLQEKKNEYELKSYDDPETVENNLEIEAAKIRQFTQTKKYNQTFREPEKIKPTPVPIELSANDSAVKVNARVYANRRKEARLDKADDPVERQQVIDFFTSQDNLEEEVDVITDTIEKEVDRSENKTEQEKRVSENSLIKAARLLGSLKDKVASFGSNWFTSLYQQSYKSKNLSQLSVPLIAKEESRNQTFEKLSEIILPFLNLPKKSQVKISKALAYAKNTYKDPSKTDEIQNITPEQLQRVNRESPIYKDDDPVLQEGIRLTEEEMVGVKAVQGMANYERNQIILQSMRRAIRLMNLNATDKDKEAFYQQFKSSTNAFRKGVEPMAFGSGKNGRQFDSNFGEKLKKLAKVIRASNDGEETSTSILLFETGERVKKVDEYFDTYYLPTSRTGDSYVAATMYVPDPKAPAFKNQYNKITVYWDAFNTESATQGRHQKALANQAVKDLQNKYQEEINQTVPEDAVDSKGNKIKKGTPIVTIVGPKPNTLNEVQADLTKDFEANLNAFLQILPQDYLVNDKNPFLMTTEKTDQERMEALKKLANQKQQKIEDILSRLREIQQPIMPTFLRASRLIPGYDYNDVTDSFGKHINSYAAWDAGFVFDSDINAAFNKIESNGTRGEKKYATALRNYLKDDARSELGLLRQASFMWFLTDISASFLNLFQGIPAAIFNGMYGGSAKASAAQLKAMGDVGLTLRGIPTAIRTNMPFDIKKLQKKLGKEIPLFQNPEKFMGTVVSPSRANEYLNKANDSIVAGEKIISNKFLKKPGESFQKVTQAAGYFFTAAELVNRLASYISSYRLTKNPKSLRRAVKILGKYNEIFNNRVQRTQELSRFKTPDQLLNNLDNLTTVQNESLRDIIARIAVEETQFLYGRIAKPRVARKLGAAVFQFSEYPTMMMELMYRLAKGYGPEGTKAFMIFMGALLVLGGFEGFPFAENIIDAGQGMLNEFGKDKDVNFDRYFKEITKDIGLNPRLAEMLQKGVSRSLNLDLGQRLTLGSHPIAAAFVDVLFGRHAFDQFKPPFFSLGQGMIDAYEYWERGDPRWKTAALPKAVKSIHESLLMHDKGYRTRYGSTTVAPQDIAMFSDDKVISYSDSIIKGLGFTSANIARLRQEAYEDLLGKKKNTYLKRIFYARYTLADADLERARRRNQPVKIKKALQDLEDIDFDLGEYNSIAIANGETDKIIRIDPTTRAENKREALRGSLNIKQGIPID